MSKLIDRFYETELTVTLIAARIYSLLSDGAVVAIAKAAAGARADGMPSKDIEKFIAHGRKTGEWN